MLKLSVLEGTEEDNRVRDVLRDQFRERAVKIEETQQS